MLNPTSLESGIYTVHLFSRLLSLLHLSFITNKHFTFHHPTPNKLSITMSDIVSTGFPSLFPHSTFHVDTCAGVMGRQALVPTPRPSLDPGRHLTLRYTPPEDVSRSNTPFTFSPSSTPTLISADSSRADNPSPTRSELLPSPTPRSLTSSRPLTTSRAPSTRESTFLLQILCPHADYLASPPLSSPSRRSPPPRRSEMPSPATTPTETSHKLVFDSL